VYEAEGLTEEKMTTEQREAKESRWRINRQVSLSIVVEMVLLGSLIVTSWFNLQGRLELLGRDVELLLERQGQLYERLEVLQERTIAHEYRIRSLEGNQEASR
jgi:hypothetical protein